MSNTGRPMPPYSSGTVMPSTPSLASLRMLSQGNVPSMYLMRVVAEFGLREIAHGADHLPLL